MTENIVKFPKKPFESFPANIEESVAHIETIRKDYCDEVSADVFEAALSVVHNYGFSTRTDEDNYIKDLIFLEETIKAFVYRYKHLHHQFHDMIEHAITMPGEIKTAENSEEKSTEAVESLN